jgi:uncharacterized membrane protein YgdD (TMEM256/DUF423 family)
MSSLRIAGLIGALGVALGAFGAHGLKATLATRGMTEVWQTAAHYHLLHSVALLALALARTPRSRWTGPLFVSGILLFSGSLYLLAFTGIRWLGAITPLGGSLLIAGWLSLLLRRSEPES